MDKISKEKDRPEILQLMAVSTFLYGSMLLALPQAVCGGDCLQN
jgi:hypothetical protein